MTGNDEVDRLKAEIGGHGAFASAFEKLADHMGGIARVSSVFGDPVERDGVTVIPVAKVWWGMGGGGGEGTRPGDAGGETGSGGGGGGGGRAVPVGYIEVSGGGARFVRFRDPAALVGPLLAGGFAAWLLLRGLRGLLRK